MNNSNLVVNFANDEISQALNCVDPSDRDLWVRMGQAVKSELGDNGFSLWNNWSQGAESYRVNDAKDVWHSISPDGGVTIRTLFYEAKTKGWHEDKSHRPVSASLRERSEHQVLNVKAVQEREQTAGWARAIWNSATEASTEHPYLVLKKIAPVKTLREIDASVVSTILRYLPKSGGEPLAGRLLVVPVKQGDGITTLELIDELGRKTALAGRGTKTGGYWTTERMPDGDGNGNGLTLLIGEGVATVLSASQATGSPGIAALSSGNLQAVARVMRELYPAADVTILADLVKTTGAPDHHAVDAANVVHGRLAIPEFGSNREPGTTDFNDMATQFGLENVKRVIDEATVPIKPDQVNLNESHDDLILPPKPDKSAMLHGLVGDIALTASEGREVNPIAVAAAAMTWLAAECGPDVSLPVGDMLHRPCLFVMHVGRSARGGKGEALGLIRRIWQTLKSERYGIQETTSQLHDGGLSSREGLAGLVHDGYREGKNQYPPIEDKRVLVVEEELGNLLAQGKRDGNTILPCLRTVFDGGSIQPLTKSRGLWATNPHICLHGAITPGELIGRIDTKELYGGTFNRFLWVFAERTGLVPLPQPTDETVVTALADRVHEAILFALGGYPTTKRDSRKAILTPRAIQAWERAYPRLKRTSGNDLIDAATARQAPIALRVALLHALLDQKLEITERHIEVGLAWAEYSAATVAYVLGDGRRLATRDDRAEQKVLDLLKNGPATRTQISKAFSGKLSRDRLNALLCPLMTDGKILVSETRHDDGRTQKIYTLGEIGEIGEEALSMLVSSELDPREIRQNWRNRLSGKNENSPIRQNSPTENMAENVYPCSFSPNSPNSPVDEIALDSVAAVLHDDVEVNL